MTEYTYKERTFPLAQVEFEEAVKIINAHGVFFAWFLSVSLLLDSGGRR